LVYNFTLCLGIINLPTYLPRQHVRFHQSRRFIIAALSLLAFLVQWRSSTNVTACRPLLLCSLRVAK